MISRTPFLIVAIGIAGWLTVSPAQAPAADQTRPSTETPAAPPDTAPSDKTKFPVRNPRYQIRPGDVLDLSFTPATDFNQTVTVQPDGYITLREAGDTYIQDKTVPEIVQAVTNAYRNVLHDPVITVVLKDFEKPHFTVGGQVGHPGKFELRTDTTATEAVAVAGGITEKAKHSQVLLFRRVSDDWVEVKQLDMKAIYNGKLKEDIHLRPGDMLYVPQNRLSKIKPFLPITALSAYMGGPF